MADKSSGYRIHRLAKRRTKRAQTAQAVALYVLAGIVAFGAVLGAVQLGRSLTAHPGKPSDHNYLALITFQGQRGQLPSAAILVNDRAGGTRTLYTIPRDLLLTAPGGEYVMAGDAMRDGDLSSYLERLIGEPFTYTLSLSYADLQSLGGASDIWVTLAQPVTLQVSGSWHAYPNRFPLPAAMIGTLLGATGKTGPDEAAAAQGILDAGLKNGALQSQQAAAQAVDRVARDVRGPKESDSRDLLIAMLSGHVAVTLIPSQVSVDQGQYSYRPDRAQIVALLARKAPAYNPPYTILVENGSGTLGIAQQVAARLAALDANLPPVQNADSFDYEQTQILAGAGAFAVAGQVRGILRRGVVLTSSGLAKNTVVVIVGKDLKPKDLQ